MTHLQLALIAGAIAGMLDVIPMLARKMAARSCLSAFLLYFFAAVIIFYSDMPVLPWWADGAAVTLAMAIPVLLTLQGKDRKAAPIILLNAVVLGFLLSVAKRFL